MLEGLYNNVQSRYRHWLNKRIPAAQSITLNQRRIFIFPSIQGFYFLLLLLLMLLAAINYQNNMVFALVFLLASVFIVSIFHTYANLSGLIITAVNSKPAFLGGICAFELSLSRTSTRDYYDIAVSWPGSELCVVTLKHNSKEHIWLHLPTNRRGIFKPGRLRIETLYPIGLLRAWTWVALDIEALIYPRPISCPLTTTELADCSEGELLPVVGSDDFYQFKLYTPGDPLKHLFWKGYAKGQELQIKEFAAYREQQRWLDWQHFENNVEQRLSNICYWVLTLENNNDEYGLRIPGVEIPPGHGEKHQARVLNALARFNTEADSIEGQL